MMIKLNTGSGEWTFFDQCRNVICNKTLVTIPAGSVIRDVIRDVKGWVAETIHVYVDLEPGDLSEVTGFVVRWDSVDGSHMLFTVTNDVYLMSDEGQTIERMHGGRVRPRS